MTSKQTSPEPTGGRRALLGAILTLSLAGLMMAPACERNKPDRKPDTSATTSQTITTTTPPSETTPDGVAPAGPIEIKDVGPAAPSVVMLGGLKGYIEPCGCTLDVKAGGIDRMVAFVEKVREFAPAHTTIAAGNIWFERKSLDEPEVAQALLKAQGIARTMAHLKVAMTVPGPTDFALGVEQYERLLGAAKTSAYGLNIKLSGKDLPGTRVVELGGMKAGIIAGVDPKLFEGIEGVEVSPIEPLLEGAIKKLEADKVDAIILLFQGELAATKALLTANPRIDFAMVGEEPRETDQVDEVGRSRTLEVFDQGRYVGVLKLYDPTGGEADEVFQNARAGSKAEIDAIERQIEHVNKSINKLPPAAPGEEPPMLKSLRDRLDAMKARRDEIKRAAIDLPEGKRAFIWRAVRLDEGYPETPSISEIKDGINAEIDRINRATDFTVKPVEDGEAFYVGNAQCKTCHADAYAFWEKTNHGHALKTLQDVKKDFNQDCIGCHVVGYDKPGGSVLGKLTYEAKLDGGEPFMKDLANVGCENCHGPASKHVEAAMYGKHGKPGNFIKNLGINEQTCMQSCHVPEHSPRFNYDVYRQQILGEGHGG